MKFQKWQALDLASFADEVKIVENIASSDAVAVRRSWYGGWPQLDGWHVSWSMSYKGEESDPDNTDVDAYGIVRTPEGLAFWWKRDIDAVEVTKVAKAVDVDL